MGESKSELVNELELKKTQSSNTFLLHPSPHPPPVAGLLPNSKYAGNEVILAASKSEVANIGTNKVFCSAILFSRFSASCSWSSIILNNMKKSAEIQI